MDSTWFDLASLQVSAAGLKALTPFLWLSGGIAVSTVAAGFRAKPNTMRVLNMAVLLPFAWLLICGFQSNVVRLLGTTLEMNSFVRAVGAIVAILAALSGLFSGHDRDRHPEWAPLMQVSVMGMSLLPGARDWISFFVYLETMAIAGYVLVGFDHERETSLEAGLKYLLTGAFGSALFLMGITLMYGATGHFEYAALNSFANSGSATNGLLVAGALLVVVSLGFKVALAPFHMWAPDVYQGSPAGSAAFLASATKVAVFGAAAVAFDRAGLWVVPGVAMTVMVLSILSIVIGNLSAIAQTKIRRMLAYSSVANAGYAGLALAVGPRASSSMLMSLAIYGLGVVAIFAVVEALRENLGGAGRYDVDIASELKPALAKTSPLAGLLMAFVLFSLAGIPPFPGFLGKYVILKDLWSANAHWGAAALVFGSLLGLAYYLKVLVVMYLNADKETPARMSPTGRLAVYTGLIATVSMIVMVLGFSRLYQWIETVEVFAR